MSGTPSAAVTPGTAGGDGPVQATLPPENADTTSIASTPTTASSSDSTTSTATTASAGSSETPTSTGLQAPPPPPGNSTTPASSIDPNSNSTVSTASLSSTTATGIGGTTTSTNASSSDGASTGLGLSGGGGGLSTGAKAGIAVGVVAVVLAIAAFFFWRFYAKRKSSRHAPGRHDPSAYGHVKHVPGGGGPGPGNPISGNTANVAEKGGITTTAAPLLRKNTDPASSSAASSPDGSLGGSGGGGAVAIAAAAALTLPQQADDATVQSKFSTLFDQIELHAENFYKDASPIIPPAIEGALSRYDTPLLGAPLAARLEQSPRATTILKHVLAYEIAVTTLTSGAGAARERNNNASGSGGAKKRSLLPQPLLALLMDLDKQRPAGSGSVRRTANKTTLNQLKHLAHTYYTAPESIPSTSTTTTSSSSSTTTITAAAAHFTQIFSLWADPAHDESRRAAHLAGLFDNAVKFTFWLLRQPETFEVRWDGNGVGDESVDGGTGGGGGAGAGGSLVTVPALVKVTRSAGAVRLGRSEEKVISRAVVRRV